MKKVKCAVVLLSFGGLAACGGSGSETVSALNLTQATLGASSATLTSSELNDQGTATPVDDTRTSLPGFVVATGDSGGKDLSSVTASILDGGASTVTLDGQTYTILPGQTISENDDFILLDDGTLTGSFASTTTVGLGSDLASSGTPDEVGVFVRGLATPASALPPGSATFDGTATLSTVGSDSTEVGSFSMDVDFGDADITGSVDVGSVDASIDATRSGSAIAGTLEGDNISDMNLTANLFGGTAEEVAGAATGDVDGTAAVIGLQGSR